jgi:hypothetical protein
MLYDGHIFGRVRRLVELGDVEHLGILSCSLNLLPIVRLGSFG